MVRAGAEGQSTTRQRSIGLSARRQQLGPLPVTSFTCIAFITTTTNATTATVAAAAQKNSRRENCPTVGFIISIA